MTNKNLNNKIKILKNKIKRAKHLFDMNEESYYIRNIYLTGMNFSEKFHPYVFNKPISENILNEFEFKNKIILPDCYKEFLVKIGNGGGSGPLGTGIYSFEESLKNFTNYNLKEYLNTEIDFKIGYFWPIAREYTSKAYLQICDISNQEIWYSHEGNFIKIEDDFLTWIEKWLDYRINKLKKKEELII